MSSIALSHDVKWNCKLLILSCLILLAKHLQRQLPSRTPNVPHTKRTQSTHLSAKQPTPQSMAMLTELQWASIGLPYQSCDKTQRY